MRIFRNFAYMGFHLNGKMFVICILIKRVLHHLSKYGYLIVFQFGMHVQYALSFHGSNAARQIENVLTYSSTHERARLFDCMLPMILRLD